MYENQMNDTAARGGSAAAGFMLGTIVGASVALLFAPATGAETRRRVGGAVRNMGNQAKQVGEKAKEGLDRVRHTAGEMKEEVRSAVDSGREAFNRTREQSGAAATPSSTTRRP